MKVNKQLAGLENKIKDFLIIAKIPGRNQQLFHSREVSSPWLPSPHQSHQLPKIKNCYLASVALGPRPFYYIKKPNSVTASPVASPGGGQPPLNLLVMLHPPLKHSFERLHEEHVCPLGPPMEHHLPLGILVPANASILGTS